MLEPEFPQDEEARIAALCRLNVLDTDPEERFDRLTRLAKRHFGVPIALVSLVDSERQWFKSCQGLDATETPRDISFCGHAILGEKIFYIENTVEDERFADNPLVTGPPHIRFYAGAPLSTPEGYRLGTLCIIDTEPRTLNEDDLITLRELADVVQDELNQVRLNRIKQAAELHESHLNAILNTIADGILTIDESGCVNSFNHAAESIFGYSESEIIGKEISLIVPDLHVDKQEAYLKSMTDSACEIVGQHKLGHSFPIDLSITQLYRNDQLNFVGVIKDLTSLKRDEKNIRQKNALLDSVFKAQSEYITTDSSNEVFEQLLKDILAFTDSEYGFIGEVEHTEEGQPYLKTHSITNISWNDETQKFYEVNASTGLEFYNLDTLFGRVISEQKVVISNDPANDPRSRGIPEGHPSLNAFLGIPFFQRDILIGMVAVANRPNGYDSELIEILQPLLATCANIIESVRHERMRIKAEQTTKQYAAALEQLHVITARNDLVFAEKITSLLELGRKTFNLPLAIISNIQGDIYTINHIVGPEGAPPVGTEFSLGDTYCYHTLAANHPLGFHYTAKSEIREHPCYQKFGLECYIGTPLIVEGERFGTLNFSSPEPREQPFTDADYSLIRLFAQWVGNEMARNRYEIKLIESIAHNQAIVETVVDGIITIDFQGSVQSFNPAAEKLFGYASDEVVGRNVNMLMPEPYAHQHDSYLGNYINTGDAKVIGVGREVEGMRKDGSCFPMELAVSEMNIHGKRMFTGIVRDITERKKIERMKSEFVSTVSHELRTPLTSIRGALGLVLGQSAGQIPEKALSMLEMADRNSERLTLLINDILDLEKIESGRLEFEFGPLDLAAVASAALDANEGYARRHNVTLKLGEGVDRAIIWGDEHRMLQVFANLISNAIKYSPEGGEVAVSTIREGEYYQATVRDHGRGIPDEFRTHIFERFAQADSSDTREKGGTGLGLSICKAIVERHQGKIDYETELGEGTQFYFKIPVWHEIQTQLGALASSQKASVLICEDNSDVAVTLASLLEQEHIVCDIASTAAATRQLLENHDYRLLLLDLHLPDGDGLDLLRELRQQEATLHLPVVIVSGRVDDGWQKFNGEALNVIDWLQKPVTRERLSDVLKQALQGAGAAPLCVLHVEDDPDIIQVTHALIGEIAEYAHVPSVKGARAWLAQEQPDIVILDLTLADGSGLDLLDELKGRCPVVIFSGQEPGAEISAQVSAALTKSKASHQQLLSTIRRVLNSQN